MNTYEMTLLSVMGTFVLIGLFFVIMDYISRKNNNVSDSGNTESKK